jgi:dihydrofolate synthase / folylpolyglutamate synthase
MNIQAIRTEVVRHKSTSLTSLLDRSVSQISERSILVITSKVVSLCEGRVREMRGLSKSVLAQEEADMYIPAGENRYGITLSVKHNMLIPNSGVDESNADGQYVLWPKDPQASANDIREYLVKRFECSSVGVIITDSTTTPLRWGTQGIALSHSGFAALHDYVGTPDIFGKTLEVTKSNIRDALAAAAVVVMGEGVEQTPLAIIEDIPFVTFQNRNPSTEELEQLHIDIDDDVYGSVLKRAPWKRGIS